MTATPSLADGLRECLALRQAGKEAAFVMSCAELVATHGPALLAALRLREGCMGLEKWEPDTSEFGIGMITDRDGDYIKVSDLARVLEESATGDEAGSA